MARENIESKAAQNEARKRFSGFVSLLSSGVVAAFGFMLIASQRWTLFDRHLAIFIILFVQWQTFGLTISKIGIENVVFAVVSSDQRKYFALRQFIVRKVLPLAAIYSSLVWLVFSTSAAIVSFASIMLDVSSLIIMADLNARGFYRVTSFSNLLNYPVFFFILICLSYIGILTAESALAAFLASSFIRWLWLSNKRFIPESRDEVVCTVNLQMGMQQVFNYLLFRSDQLLLSFFLLTAFAAEKINVYVYMAKFPELVAGVIVVAGAVYFPEMYIQYSASGTRAFQQIKNYPLYALGYGLILAVGIAMYRSFWNGALFPIFLVLPFLIHSLLVIFVNNVTYSMLRQGYMSGLLRNLILSVAAGLLYFALVLGRGINYYALAWLIPIQIFVFLLLSFFSTWGKKADIYA